MDTPDFFCARLDAMIDQRHPLVVLTGKLAWDRIEQALAPKFVHQKRPMQKWRAADLLGDHAVVFGGGASNAGRPRLPIRLMVSLLYLKNSFYLSDEELVQRWSENVVFQFFSGMEYYESRLPCDATQIGRFRRTIGDGGSGAAAQMHHRDSHTDQGRQARRSRTCDRRLRRVQRHRASGGQPPAGDKLATRWGTQPRERASH